MAVADPTYEDLVLLAEDRLVALGSGLDRPLSGATEAAAVAIGLGMQAALVYEGVRQACAAGSTTSAMIIVRALIEVTILLRWIEADRELHVRMWLAEDDRQRILAAEAFTELRTRRGLDPIVILTDDEVTAMRATANNVRTEARRRREHLGDAGAVMPSIEHMARTTDDLWEAYSVVYRVASPWTHTGGRALSGHRIEARVDGPHLVPENGWTGMSIRALAAPAFAMALASASRQAGLALHSEADSIRVGLTVWLDQPPVT